MTAIYLILIAAVLNVPDEVARVLDCAEKTGESLETVRAELRQNKTYRYFPGEEEATGGSLIYRKPVMVLRITTPVRKTLWVGKDKVEIYTPSTGQLERWERGANSDKPPSPFSLTINRNALLAEYHISLARATEQAYTLHLEPKPETPASKNFESRSITFRKPDCLPLRFEFIELSGDKTVIELIEPTINALVKEREVRTSYPRDVEIIPLNDISLQ